MKLSIKKPAFSLNKAYRKVKPQRDDFEAFKANLSKLLNHASEDKFEDFNKTIAADFLKDTYYSPKFAINIKQRNDLVIHTGESPDSEVGVIVEAKAPANKAEMITRDNANVKALHELVLYFLRERITNKNKDLKHLIATNCYEWFLFDAHQFEKAFAQNKSLVKQYENFIAGRLTGTSTDFFYKEIAKPFIEKLEQPLECTWFDLRAYEKNLASTDEKSERKLIALYKIFSPEHILKLNFANDSNSLDQNFYKELLHIIGLEETKVKGKKLIGRKEEESRNPGSLLENTIDHIESLDKLSRVKSLTNFGETRSDRLFNVALELCITWMNRILFLKLLEAQLISYQKGDKSVGFLNTKRIKDFDVFNDLFFQVLARKYEERSVQIKAEFGNVPYLNSSLFDPTELEHDALFISNLRDDMTLPLLSQTVLKGDGGKRRKGEMSTIAYLFEFLDAYDFTSEGSEDIQEESKTLINASVLGLIFEKINGYKDGSFFTPGFITMYMCRETIRRAVVQKFNEAKGWNCESFDDIDDKIEDRNEANAIINSLKICDPAVGSGHFLVSALNEILAIKHDLRILQDRDGKRLREYHLEVVNDELIITDSDGDLFEYHPNSPESQRVQEALFHEKQTIIENCLFGVDINSNSVKICRLRLWIELLKHAYYKTHRHAGLDPASPVYGETPDQVRGDDVIKKGEGRHLETLPNIDINIKTGNSLISRFALDADLKEALKKSKWGIESYRAAVQSYRNARNKDEKREMMRLIDDIKGDFRTEILRTDKNVLKLKKLRDELVVHTTQTSMFDQTAKEKKEWKKTTEKFTKAIAKLEAEIEEIKNNKIYENAFEWRFEFPEVLNEKGDFVGFDVVIGNPPYVPSSSEAITENAKYYYHENYKTAEYQINTFGLFIERASMIIKAKAEYSYIIPNYWLSTKYDSKLREFVFQSNGVHRLVNTHDVFKEAVVDTLIIEGEKVKPKLPITIDLKSINPKFLFEPLENGLHNESMYIFSSAREFSKPIDYENITFKENIKLNTESTLGQLVTFSFGLKPYQVGKGNPPQSKNDLKEKKYNSDFKKDDDYLQFIKAKNLGFLTLKKDMEWIKYGKHLAEPRSIELFSGSRIVMGRIISGKRINAVLLHKELLCNTDLITIKPNLEISIDHLVFILGVLVSKLTKYYLISTNINLDRKVFPKINTKTLLEFPIPEFNLELVKKVTEILSFKKENPQADTSKLEAEIDQMVYELYGLTEEEIAIVEESLG